MSDFGYVRSIQALLVGFVWCTYYLLPPGYSIYLIRVTLFELLSFELLSFELLCSSYPSYLEPAVRARRGGE